MRVERDFLGEVIIASDALYGIHSVRARDNFAISGRVPHKALITALAQVKMACAEANAVAGILSAEKSELIYAAAAEIAAGRWHEQIIVDAYQGGAGTSLNMNINEVIANRALCLAGKLPGDYAYIDPLREVNISQSTNDTYPTALRIAAIRLVLALSDNCAALQGALQNKEREYAGVLKIGRTELQDAVPMTVGHTFGAWAEAIARDRWRLYKAEERLREINLGGTAIGTGINASRAYIFSAVERLRAITGLGLARKENLIDATQNADVFAEVSGIVKACAVNAAKIAADMRLLASGPRAGLGELLLPDLQAGSSIMPGKVNPVMTEMLTQAAWQYIANDGAITYAAQGGQLELNAFLPLIAENLLGGVELLSNAIQLFAQRCVTTLEIDALRCQKNLEGTAGVLTALVPKLGYERVTQLVKIMLTEDLTATQVLVQEGVLTPQECAVLMKVEKLTRPT